MKGVRPAQTNPSAWASVKPQDPAARSTATIHHHGFLRGDGGSGVVVASESSAGVSGGWWGGCEEGEGEDPGLRGILAHHGTKFTLILYHKQRST